FVSILYKKIRKCKLVCIILAYLKAEHKSIFYSAYLHLTLPIALMKTTSEVLPAEMYGSGSKGSLVSNQI
ncbi:MAG: hypothetical protein J6T74_06575, partial [Clostridia bacterium]|nr:hypothetical protein [Clostridia bacterium]